MKTTRLVVTAIQLVICAFPLAPAFAADTKSASKHYEIANTQVIEIRSEVLKRTYELYVKLPPSYSKESDRRYPVVFLNDAAYSFPLACSLTRQLMNGGKIEEVIVVGISYSKGDDPDVSRTRDYTPTNSPEESIGHSPEAKRLSGEASKYLRFITNEVVPMIANGFRIDRTKKTLAGHSFGGLFSAYVAVVAPASFENYLVSDPSLWYDDEVIFKFATQAQSRRPGAFGILVVNANPDLAQRGSSKESGTRSSMAVRGERFGKLMIERVGGRAAWKAFDGEIHETIFPIALSHALIRFHGKQ